MKYYKLVRDKIPEIIKAKGDKPVTHVATPEEYDQKIREKLQEEVNEFLASNSPEELADIMEVLYTLAGRQGVSPEELEKLRKRKADERGGFEHGIMLDES